MTEWALVLTPILVLPLVLLFRFVGCAQIAGLKDPVPETPSTTPSSSAKPPRYRDYIMGAPNNPGTVKNPGVVPNKNNVIAYWRLVEIPTELVAHDEKGFQDGEYHTSASAETAPGDFVPGQNGLIASDPTHVCRFFNGGHVLIPYKNGLFTEEFTIEAWVIAGSFAAGSEHVLFDAGGFYVPPFSSGSPAFHGFRVSAKDNSWQVRLQPNNTDAFASPPLIPRPGRTHLAVTVENAALGGAKKKVTIFIDGKATAPAITNFYSLPDGAPLFIGVGNEESNPNNVPKLVKPIRSTIQEVVLHKKALSKEEIENHVDINR